VIRTAGGMGRTNGGAAWHPRWLSQGVARGGRLDVCEVVLSRSLEERVGPPSSGREPAERGEDPGSLGIEPLKHPVEIGQQAGKTHSRRDSSRRIGGPHQRPVMVEP
jgi:hypothetical protein